MATQAAPPPPSSKYIATARLSAQGTDISRYRVVPIDSDKLALELVTSDATPTIPQSIASGDFDGDGLLDIVAILVLGDGRDATTYRLYMALGIESSSGRVVGLSAPNDGQRSRVFVRDFNGDGHDDVLVGSSAGYSIFSMGPTP